MFYKIFRRIFVGILALVALITNAKATPTKDVTPEDAQSVVYADTAFGDLKLFLPQDVEDGAEVLLMVHGGGWLGGNASMFYKNCRAAAQAGYIAASVNYSKIQNGASAADMVNEIGLAIAALKAELLRQGIQPGKLILAGHSAGAHIMLLYAYTQYKQCPLDIAFVVSNCAPTDFLCDAKTRTTTLGKMAYYVMSALTKELVLPNTLERTRDAVAAITPLTFITPDVPPTIVVQGDADSMVPFQNSVELYSALQENGVDSVHIVYAGADHFLGAEFAEGNEARDAAFRAFEAKYCAD